MKLLLKSPETEVQVWPSYTDVAFTVILILLFYLFAQAVVSSQTSAILMEIRSRQKSLSDAVRQRVAAQDVTVTDDLNIQRYGFADRVLFDSGQAELKESGKQILQLFGEAVGAQIGSFSKIQVEGHTDDNPIKSARFPSNWELSSARATSVVRFLQERCGLNPALMSANGYSEYQPVDRAGGEAAKARNRRIEIVIFYSGLEAKDTRAK